MNPNQRYYCYCLSAHSQGKKAAVLDGSKWPPGSVVRIRFLEGDPALQRQIIRVAKEWEPFSGITFDFNNGYANEEADIRIALKPGDGSWSYLGVECRDIPPTEATMNYGWLTLGSEPAELRRVVLHEFGHALGLIHEHQNPSGGISWDKKTVERDLSLPPNNWDAATIHDNMYRHYEADTLTASDVDRSSIMMYPIPATWTTDGSSAGLNDELTETDKAIVRLAYSN